MTSTRVRCASQLIVATLVLFSCSTAPEPAPPGSGSAPPTTATAPATASPATATAGARPADGRVRIVDNPAGADSAQVDLDVALNGTVRMTWLEGGDGSDGEDSMRFSTWNGTGWSAARTIVSGVPFFANWADLPSIAAFPTGELMAHWLELKEFGTSAYDVRYSISRDGGESWSTPATVHDDRTMTEHGFASLLPIGSDGMAVVWLDMSDTPDAAPGDGIMAMRLAIVSPAGEVITRAVLDPRVCECCATTAVRLEEGIKIFYRDRGDAEQRDIACLALTPPHVVSGGVPCPSPDGWVITGCPVNGPVADAAVPGGNAAVAWYTGARDTPKVKFASSIDGGLSFPNPTIEIASGDLLGRVGMAVLADGGALVSWIADDGQSGQILARRVHADGQLGAPFRIADAPEPTAVGIPRLARAGSAVIAAWTEPGPKPRVRTAVIDPGP